MDRGLQAFQEKGDTWPKVLRYNADRFGHSRRAMRHKHYGLWQPYTWQDYYDQVKQLALGLQTQGLQTGDRVLIVGDNTPQWYQAELAVQALRGIAVGVCPDLLPQEIKGVSENAEARFAVVEDQEQVDKFLALMNELPGLEKVIFWNYKGLAHYREPLLMGYNQVLEQGARIAGEHPGLFEELLEKGKADDVCALVYTSGTCSDVPKGVVHTFRSMRAGAEALLRLDPWQPEDNLLPFLPPAWMPEQWLNIGCHLLSACTLNFAESPETQQRDLKETGPSIVSMNAAMWESQASLIQARMQDTDALQKALYRLLMPLGYKAADRRIKKESPGIINKVLFRLAEKILFKPLRKSLGLGQGRIGYSFGAVLNPEILRFFQSLNLPLKNIYFSTEAGPLTGVSAAECTYETPVPIPGEAEVKINEMGEILYRQAALFSGYYNNPALTEAVFEQGWFHSGDQGFFREDGQLHIEGRISEMVSLTEDIRLFPQRIEGRLKLSPHIKEAWVFVGPDRAYVSAVIIINFQSVSRWAGRNRVAFSNLADLVQQAEVQALVREEIARVNSGLEPAFRIKKLVCFHRELDPDEGEVTRNRKLRRAFLEKRYRELVESIYQGSEEVVMESQIRQSGGGSRTVQTRLTILSL
ncbi:MAG: AMP-binding protein [Thermodesulfobacteriota bacterium]